MLRRRVTSVLCALAAVLILSHQICAQTITTGVLSGTVTNEVGAVLADVSVTATPMSGGASQTIVTTYDGAFRFPVLLPGTYSLLVERLGYRPKVVEHVPIRPGRALRVDVDIVPSPPPIEEAEHVAFDADPGASRPGLSQWISALSFQRLPWERRETSELAGLATSSTTSLQTEGLPSWLSTVKIDGLPYNTARHPALNRAVQREIALPVGMLESAEFVTADADVEWSGFAGGALAAHTRRGAQQFAFESFGSWSGSGLNTSKFFDTDVANTSLWGGAIMSGPIVRDSAHFAFGVEARKLQTPLHQPWQRDATIDAAVVAAAQSAHGVDLGRYTSPFALESNVVSGFGRFDWQVANDNALSVRFGFGNISAPQGGADLAAASAPETIGNGQDLLLTASLESRFGRWAHEVRAGVLRSTRNYQTDETAASGDMLPSTRVVEGGLHFGADPTVPAQFRRTELNIDQSLQAPGSVHQLKLGVTVGVTWHDDTYAPASLGDFVFGGPSEFSQSRGSFLQSSVAGVPELKFNVARVGAYIQDVWNAGPGLRLTAGVRFDGASLPQSDIVLNQEWLTATGLANNSIDNRATTASPRFKLTWELATGWTVMASAGRYVNDPDAAVLNELLLGDGNLQIRRAAGNLGDWPTPTAANVPASRPALTLVGPGYRAPQTDRASFGLGRRIGAATIQLSGTYRNTEFLTRRSDLNLFTTPSAHDQNGRPIFGSLVKLGELITVAQPNRRFTNFDLVSGLSATGWSHYWGVTAAIEQSVNANLGFFASYTHSQTTDNWLVGRDGGGPQSQLSPFPNEVGTDWREGTSDFDVPDRISAGVELRPGGVLQPRLTATYHFRSGYPFTPGFRVGVDANGDGSDSNDPAFVDESVAGIADLVRSFDCLRDQTGGFAERNACRTDGVHSLNVRVGLTLLNSSGTSAEIFVDGINLIESSQAEPDAALFLVNRNGTLVVDQTQGTVNTPLVANPHFGMPLVRFGTGRMLRIGLQVNH